MLSLKSLCPWTVTLSLNLATVTLTSLYLSANDSYPSLRAVPNLSLLALLKTISILSDDYTGTPDPISLDRLSTLYVYQPGELSIQVLRPLDVPPPNSSTQP